MKKKLIAVIIILYFSYGFISTNPYEKYQLFNEYQLKGISERVTDLKDPYILTLRDNDTIWVRISNQLEKEPIKYIHKGSYWYNLIVEDLTKEKGIENCMCDTTIVMIKEKFIFNDTIVTYHSEFKKNIKEKIGTHFSVDTKTIRLKLYINENIENYPNRLDRMKYYINHYKELGFYYFGFDDFSLPSKTVYELYNKEIANDSICYYKPAEDKNYKLGCLHSVYKSINNMNEFDPYYENILIFHEWESDICK